MQDLAFAIPGVDEAMSFAEIMKYVERLLILNRFLTMLAQACQVHGILCDCIRHSTYRTYSSISLVSLGARKGAGKIKFTRV